MRSSRRRGVRFAPALAVITFAVLTSPGWIALMRSRLALHETESAGQEVGTLVKLSRKGWVCKTWEGEMVTSGGDRTIPTHFLFSVRKPEVARTLASHLGQSVVVQYAQHPVVPPSCFGDTDYFIEHAAPVTTAGRV
jgi:hypothetical protein